MFLWTQECRDGVAWSVANDEPHRTIDCASMGNAEGSRNDLISRTERDGTHEHELYTQDYYLQL